MKKLVMVFLCLILSVTGKVLAQDVQTGAGILKFKELVHDYGEVPEGPRAEFDFVFKNKGSKPLVISDAVAGCGCTTTSWSHDPIFPGKKGKIHVIYNTLQRPGNFTKQVTVKSNASEPVIVLQIKGTVITTKDKVTKN